MLPHWAFGVLYFLKLKPSSAPNESVKLISYTDYVGQAKQVTMFVKTFVGTGTEGYVGKLAQEVVTIMRCQLVMGVGLIQAVGISFDQIKKLNLHLQAVGFLDGP